MKIYFVTTNKGKVQSVQRYLKEEGISVIQKPLDLIEPRSSDVQEIAKVKIKQAYSKIKKPTIVVDAGFYITSLNGFPRAFVNFTLNTIGLTGLLKLIKNKSRECEFRECLAYMDKTLKEPKYFLSHVKGKLAKRRKGILRDHLWSKLALIFIPKNCKKTLAEMSPNEHSQWVESSREESSLGKKLCNWLRSR